VEETRPRFATAAKASSTRATPATPVPLAEIEATEETRIATGIA
jgi:hypothetical protein